MKYGSGFPFHRLERLEANLGIPLPASTQWEMVRDGGEHIQPAFEELIRQAASGEVLYNDDTSVKILEFVDHDCVVEDPQLPGRTGVFTTGIVSTREGRKIALFFSLAANTPEKTSPMCWRNGRANYRGPFKCAMPCREICHGNWKSSSPITSRTAAVTSSKLLQTFLRNAATS